MSLLIISLSSDSCLLLVLVKYIAANEPDKAVTIPAIVGSVALETPPAIALASPPPHQLPPPLCLVLLLLGGPAQRTITRSHTCRKFRDKNTRP